MSGRGIAGAGKDAPEATADSPSRIVVATYNVRRCIGTDGVCDVNRVARIIADIGAHAVALQELSFREAPNGVDQLARLAEMTGYHAERCLVHRTKQGGVGLGLLSRDRPLEVEEVDLSFEKSEPRAALSASFDWGGRKVRMVLTHLGLRWRERRYQAEILASELTRRGDEDLRILLGDLNDWVPGSPNLAALDGPVQKAAFGTATFPSWLPILSLDEIWVSPGDSVQKRYAVRSRLSRQASDHLPLVAELSL